MQPSETPIPMQVPVPVPATQTRRDARLGFAASAGGFGVTRRRHDERGAEDTAVVTNERDPGPRGG